jgi:hypothetical protein
MEKELPFPGGYPYVNNWITPDQRDFPLLVPKARA